MEDARFWWGCQVENLRPLLALFYMPRKHTHNHEWRKGEGLPVLPNLEEWNFWAVKERADMQAAACRITKVTAAL